MAHEDGDRQPPILPCRERHVCIAAGLIGLAAVLLHLPQLLHPALLYDDFQIVLKSFDWPAVQDSFWEPHNEHVMPLGRVSTWLLIRLAGRVTLLPLVTGWQGMIATLIGMVLILIFVRRQTGQAWHGLAAMALFGVTTQYREAVAWFSASFAILALDTILVALLAAQRWRQTGRFRWLFASALASALAPASFASGILAGPFAALYLLCQSDGRPPCASKESSPDHAQSASRSRLAAPAWVRLAIPCLVPLLGTAVFIATGLLRNLDYIMHLEHWGPGRSARDAFHPWLGIIFTARSLADNLFLGTIGIWNVYCPPWLVGGVVLLMSAAWLFGFSFSGCRCLLILGTAFILVSYWMIYSARAEWGYERIAQWGRYQLFPQAGLALIVAASIRPLPWRWPGPLGLPFWIPVGILVLVVVLLFLSQVPRALVHYRVPQQADDLARIEAMDRRCREHGIAAETARQVLPPFQIAASGDRVNGWDLLAGSPDPRPITLDQARELLQRENGEWGISPLPSEERGVKATP